MLISAWLVVLVMVLVAPVDPSRVGAVPVSLVVVGAVVTGMGVLAVAIGAEVARRRYWRNAQSGQELRAAAEQLLELTRRASEYEDHVLQCALCRTVLSCAVSAAASTLREYRGPLPERDR